MENMPNDSSIIVEGKNTFYLFQYPTPAVLVIKTIETMTTIQKWDSGFKIQVSFTYLTTTQITN